MCAFLLFLNTTSRQHLRHQQWVRNDSETALLKLAVSLGLAWHRQGVQVSLSASVWWLGECAVGILGKVDLASSCRGRRKKQQQIIHYWQSGNSSLENTLGSPQSKWGEY